MSSGFSWARNTLSLLPSRLWKGRELMAATWSARAELNSPRDMNRLPLSASMAWRSMRPTPISTLALSLGLLTLAGTTAHP